MSVLEKVCSKLNEEKIPYAIVGGFAVALHGAIRGTIDIDLITKLTLKNFVAFEKAMLELGLESRLPVTAKEVFNFREEYIKNRNLIAWSFFNPKKPIEVIDVIITEDLTGMKTIDKNLRNQKIKVLSLPDLISMKEKSGRPQDLEDVKTLKELLK
ncbi:MAG: hypothetical protein R3B45_16925 [Bdellovibrionota bacterium]